MKKISTCCSGSSDGEERLMFDMPKLGVCPGCVSRSGRDGERSLDRDGRIDEKLLTFELGHEGLKKNDTMTTFV